MTAIRLVPGKLQSIELTDADTDVEFHSDTYNVPDSSTFTAPNITEENTGQYMNFYNYITTQYASTYHRWQAWETFVFGNLGGRIVNLQKNAEFRLPLNGYDPDNIDVFFYNTKSIIPAIENIKGHAEGNYYVVQAPVATMFLMCEKKPKGDGASLAEGFYSVDVSVWHYTNYVNGQTSMANGAMVNPAQLAVRGDGSRTLYLGVKSLTISGFQGYLSHMWVGDGAGGVTPVTVSEYYKDANGSYYIDEIARDMGVPYPKYVYFDLPSAEDRIHARFQAPIMDALAGGQPSPQDAWLQIEYGTAEQINEITLPQSEVFVDEPAANKTALSSALTVAKTITKGNKVDSAWENLQAAIADAQTVYDRGDVTQVQVDNALSALNLAVGAFYAAETVGGGTLDKDNLADGSYVLNADMIHMNRNQKSMADGAIDHNVKLTVEGGAYYLTVDFHGLTVPLGNQSFFGYLKDLKYYDAGFTYNYGALVGATKPATVLDSYENVVDQYNDVSPKDGVPDYKYPKTLKFPLVNKAGYVDNYVPLQVFVPIMEAISTGSGTQDVLMRLDWSSLRLPGAVLPDPTYTDPNTGITIEAGGGALPDGAKFDVAPVAPGADAYARGKDILADVGTKFALYDISLSSSNVKVQPNGTVKVSLPVPAGMNAGRVAVYRIEDSGAKTLLTSEVSGGNLSFYTDHFSLFAIVERAEEAGQTWIPSTGSPMPASSVAVASALTSLSSLKIVASDKVWTGKKIATGFVLAVGGKKLSAGKDYSIKSTGANKNIGAGTVKIAGKGGYTGAATVKFKIVPKAVSVKSAKAGVKALALSFAKAPKAEKITKYEVRWRVKGAKSWSAPKAVSPAKAALTVNQLKKGKSYDVQARVYKTVSGSKYYSEWSKVKASAKVL
ncbi:MAG: NEAT domain-containing protein [Clostridiales Family XIII bacterium]|nr:NEAT domain-containing protein [Clostridiales Family XIII bacterium]